jgi:hypothetical protein
MIVHLWAAGTGEPSGNKISMNVRPNPARENVSVIIEGYENTPATLTLLNMNGQTVYTEELTLTGSAVTKQIDLGSFARGIYTVRLKTDQAVETRKLVVQ